MNTSKDYLKALHANKNGLFQIIGNLKFENNLKAQEKIINDIAKKKLFKGLINKLVHVKPLPKEYTELKNRRIIGSTNNLYNELNWVYHTIKKHKAEIDRFLVLKTEFDKSILIEDFDKAETIINEIDNEICVSFWSIESRFILNEYKTGKEANWIFLSEISKKSEETLFVILANLLSFKAEKDISFSRYQYILADNIRSIKPGFLQEYLFFKYCFSFSIDFRELPQYFVVESFFSVIDRYLLLNNILKKNFLNLDKSKTIHFVKTLKNEIKNDFLLQQLVNYFDSEEYEKLTATEDVNSLYDLFLQGKFEETTKEAKRLIHKYPNIIFVYELYCKSLIARNIPFKKTNISGLLDSILENLFNVFQKNEKTIESVHFLKRIISIFSSFDFSFSLLITLLYLTEESDYRSEFLSWGIVTSPFNFPDLSLVKNDEKRNKLFFNSPDYFKKLNSFQLYNYLASEEKDFDVYKYPTDLRNFIKAKMLIKERLNKEAIKHIESFTSSTNMPMYLLDEIYLDLFNLYLEENYTEKAVKDIVKKYLINENIIMRFNKKRLLLQVENSKVNDLKKLIDLPILLNISASSPYDQYVAYDEFMEANNIDRPSEIKGKINSFNKQKMIFFLKNVCSIDVLRHSYFFEGTNDLESERMSICHILKDIDGENNKDYDNEIAEISRNSSIRKVIQQVNKGRITINIDKLIELEFENWQEGFSRYIQQSNYSKEKKLMISNINSQDLKDYFESSEKKIPQRSEMAFTSFCNLFLEIRDKYLFSPEFGLDGYLSTRIRHGTFFNHIRSIFENLKIITSKDNNGDYIDSTYWKNKNVDLSQDCMDKIQISVKEFSKRIDDFTERIIQEFIQIQTEKKDGKQMAWFDYRVSRIQLIRIYTKGRFCENYSDFLDFVIRILTKTTEDNLKDIRTLLLGNIKSSYENLIRKFSDDIKFVNKGTSLPELNTSIMKAHTEIQTVLERITEWFNVSESDSSHLLDIETLIHTSVKINNNINPSCKLSPKYDIDHRLKNISIMGRDSMIYICRILLENIRVHSGLDEKELEVNIKAELNDKSILVLSFFNNLNLSVDREKLIKKLNFVKTNWSFDASNLGNISREGGSGFSKINRILTYDMRSINNYFDFLLSDNGLEITIGFQLIII